MLGVVVVGDRPVVDMVVVVVVVIVVIVVIVVVVVVTDSVDFVIIAHITTYYKSRASEQASEFVRVRKRVRWAFS